MADYFIHVSPFGDCFVQVEGDPTHCLYAPPDSRRFPNYQLRVSELRGKLEGTLASLDRRYERVERLLPQGIRGWICSFAGGDERVLSVLRKIDRKIGTTQTIVARLLEEERACSETEREQKPF